MIRKLRRCPTLVLCLLVASAFTTTAQTNLLLNPKADNDADSWRVFGQAGVEEFKGEKVFVIRRDQSDGSGGFAQDVSLMGSDVGKYALLIGRGSSERINMDGAITGLPYLYGYMMESITSCGGKIKTYLQGQRMLAHVGVVDEWVTMYGVFRVPEGTVAITFFLNQAERRGVPQNGSAARFDDLGIYLFETEQEALQFAQAYR